MHTYLCRGSRRWVLRRLVSGLGALLSARCAVALITRRATGIGVASIARIAARVAPISRLATGTVVATSGRQSRCEDMTTVTLVRSVANRRATRRTRFSVGTVATTKSGYEDMSTLALLCTVANDRAAHRARFSELFWLLISLASCDSQAYARGSKVDRSIECVHTIKDLGDHKRLGMTDGIRLGLLQTFSVWIDVSAGPSSFLVHPQLPQLVANTAPHFGPTHSRVPRDITGGTKSQSMHPMDPLACFTWFVFLAQFVQNRSGWCGIGSPGQRSHGASARAVLPDWLV